MRTLKEIVSGDNQVKFVCFKDSELWYVTDCGFDFPVPIEDAKGATFNASDRAMIFMRWIRKHMAMLDAAKNASKVD